MNSLEELLNIDTPENVTFDYEVAGIGSRFMAALVDTTLIVVAIAALLILTLSLVLNWLNSFSDGAAMTVAAVVLLLSFAIVWGYYIFFEITWAGQTPGKRWVGLRVVGLNGLPVSATAAIIRNIVRVVDFFPSAYGVGLIAMFLHPQARRLGDLAAGTLVIFDQTAVTIESLSEKKALGTAVNIPPEIASLPLHLLSKRHIEGIDSFLARRMDLSNRHELGSRLYQQIYQSMGLTPPTNLAYHKLEEELSHILHAYRQKKM